VGGAYHLLLLLTLTYSVVTPAAMRPVAFSIGVSHSRLPSILTVRRAKSRPWAAGSCLAGGRALLDAAWSRYPSSCC